jgi:RNase P/RNase MRP subunit p29
MFTSSQDANVLKENIKQALKGKVITENEDTLEVSDSALKKVKVTADDFEMWINPERVIYY